MAFQKNLIILSSYQSPLISGWGRWWREEVEPAVRGRWAGLPFLSDTGFLASVSPEDSRKHTQPLSPRPGECLCGSVCKQEAPVWGLGPARQALGVPAPADSGLTQPV